MRSRSGPDSSPLLCRLTPMPGASPRRNIGSALCGVPGAFRLPAVNVAPGAFGATEEGENAWTRSRSRSRDRAPA